MINGYKIYKNGTIIGKRGKPLKQTPSKKGDYLRCNINLGDYGMVYCQHRAIGFAFIPNPDNLPEINHKNGIKWDNRVENLEWCTESDNQFHASYELFKRIGEDGCNAKLTEEEVLEIYQLCKENKLLRKDIAAMFGVSPDCLKEIARGKSWKYLGLEPIKLVRGQNGRGSTHLRKKYKLIDTLTNEEYIFDKSKDVGDIVGLSDNTIRSHCKKELHKTDLYNERYLYFYID